MIRIPQEFKQICQDRLPEYSARFPAPGLPGTRPVSVDDWLMRDDAFDQQLAFRAWLIEQHRSGVIAQMSGAQAAAIELLDMVVDQVEGEPWAQCSGAGQAGPDHHDPLAALGHLVQEDFCILQRQGAQHVLTAALLCFPSSWSLSEKIGRPLTGIHEPVDSYSPRMGARVQRMFDAVRPGTVLCRTNLLHYVDPCLHHPRTQANQRKVTPDTTPDFVRVERQTIRKLPKTRAVVFGIHSFVVRVSSNKN